MVCTTRGATRARTAPGAASAPGRFDCQERRSVRSKADWRRTRTLVLPSSALMLAVTAALSDALGRLKLRNECAYIEYGCVVCKPRATGDWLNGCFGGGSDGAERKAISAHTVRTGRARAEMGDLGRTLKQKPSTAHAIARLAAAGALLLSGRLAMAQDASATSHQMYLELLRNADAFVGKPLSFAGKVIESIDASQGQSQGQSPDQNQVQSRAYALRVNVTPGKFNSWQDTIYVEYQPAALIGQDRIADGALVSIRGTFTGTKSYRSVIGDTITVPSVRACAIHPGVENIAACPGETAAAPARQ